LTLPLVSLLPIAAISSLSGGAGVVAGKRFVQGCMEAGFGRCGCCTLVLHCLQPVRTRDYRLVRYDRIFDSVIDLGIGSFRYRGETASARTWLWSELLVRSALAFDAYRSTRRHRQNYPGQPGGPGRVGSYSEQVQRIGCIQISKASSAAGRYSRSWCRSRCTCRVRSEISV